MWQTIQQSLIFFWLTYFHFLVIQALFNLVYIYENQCLLLEGHSSKTGCLCCPFLFCNFLWPSVTFEAGQCLLLLLTCIFFFFLSFIPVQENKQAVSPQMVGEIGSLIEEEWLLDYIKEWNIWIWDTKFLKGRVSFLSFQMILSYGHLWIAIYLTATSAIFVKFASAWVELALFN